MGPRSLEDDLAYGERWDKDRFMAERERERDRIVERDRFPPSGGRTRQLSPDRPERRALSSRPPWEDDRRRPARYVDDDPPAPRFRRSPPPEMERDIERIVIDKERERDYRVPSPPRRPGMALRRQSSLDTFDRRPLARFHEEEKYGPPARRSEYRPEPYEPIPLPRSRRLPPPRIYAERDYDEIKIAEPDRYGNEEYHDYPELLREREIVKSRRRRSNSRNSRAHTHRSNSSHRTRSKSRARTATTRSSSSSSSSSSSGGTTVTAKNEYPKKGKTRIPAPLVSVRALMNLGYPFIQEGNTIVVQKALSQDNIDDVLKLSDDYKKAENEVNSARSSHVFEDRRQEEVYTIPPPPLVPPPVGIPQIHTAPPPQASAPALAPAPPPPEIINNQTMVFREPSPSVYSARSRRSHSTSTSMSRRTPVVVDAHPWEASSEVPVGPLALVNDRRRTDRDIKMEIAQLEAERDFARRERHHGHHHSHSHSHSHSPHVSGGELVRAERLPTGELVLYEQEIERIEEPRRGPRIEKDKKGRMSISVPKFK